MASALGREFDARVRWLKSDFPPKRGKVSVRTQKRVTVGGVEVQGVAYQFSNGDHLVIVERGPLPQASDTLLHEWAHVLQHGREPFSSDPAKQHSELWGSLYSQIYRAYVTKFT